MHNHGNHSSAVNDGQPEDLLIPTGGSRTYIYDGLEGGGNQRGKMQFYHDHRMDVTGRNVWMGLTGMYIVDDPADPPTLPPVPSICLWQSPTGNSTRTTRSHTCLTRTV